jgi:hypothetical protein
MRFLDLCIMLVVVTAVLWGASVALPEIREFIHELATFYIWI